MNTNIYIFSVLNPVFKRFFFLMVTVIFYMLSNTNIIDSETIQVTTYYPAPYGAYYRFLTTDNTWLARNGGNVAIGLNTALYKLDISGNVRISGRLGTNGYPPDSGYPRGWGGGIHTWDVYAEGSVGTGQSGNLGWSVNSLGVMSFSSTGRINGLCNWRPFGSAGWDWCLPGEVVVNVNYTGTATERYYMGGQQWITKIVGVSGQMLCCRLN